MAWTDTAEITEWTKVDLLNEYRLALLERSSNFYLETAIEVGQDIVALQSCGNFWQTLQYYSYNYGYYFVDNDNPTADGEYLSYNLWTFARATGASLDPAVYTRRYPTLSCSITFDADNGICHISFTPPETANEKQEIAWASTPTDGTYTIKARKNDREWVETAAIEFNATAEDIQDALDLVLGNETNEEAVTVTISSGKIRIEFTGDDYKEKHQPLVKVVWTNLEFTTTKGVTVKQLVEGKENAIANGSAVVFHDERITFKTFTVVSETEITVPADEAITATTFSIVDNTYPHINGIIPYRRIPTYTLMETVYDSVANKTNIYTDSFSFSADMVGLNLEFLDCSKGQFEISDFVTNKHIKVSGNAAVGQGRFSILPADPGDYEDPAFDYGDTSSGDIMDRFIFTDIQNGINALKWTRAYPIDVVGDPTFPSMKVRWQSYCDIPRTAEVYMRQTALVDSEYVWQPWALQVSDSSDETGWIESSTITVPEDQSWECMVIVKWEFEYTA